ncbi:hypothetical protein AAEY33_06315 [Peribacillus simplex]
MIYFRSLGAIEPLVSKMKATIGVFFIYELVVGSPSIDLVNIL